MELLELFYEKSLVKSRFLPRKATLPSGQKVVIQGPKYCGKYSFVQYTLQEQKANALVIDCEDPRYDAQYTKANLANFIQAKNIDTVVFYGIEDFIYSPPVRTIFVSHHFLPNPYPTLQLHNLDFEEFMLFDKHSDPKVLFNHFLKWGNYPEISQTPEYKKEKRLWEIYKLTFDQELSIFAQLTFFQGHNTSVYFAYNRLKNHLKISKDRFYRFFEKLQQDGILFAIPKYGSQRAPKRLFFHDFLAKTLFHLQKEFPKIFENMVFLELKDKELFYLEPLGLYIPKERKIVLSIPFGNEVRIQNKIEQILAKNRVEVEKIEVVSVGSRFVYETGSVTCEVLPFYEWAVGR